MVDPRVTYSPVYITPEGVVDEYGCLLNQDKARTVLLAAAYHLRTYSAEEIEKQNDEVEAELLEREKNIPAKQPKREKPGYVYLIYNKRNHLTKIGYSTNPRHRESTLQSEEPEVELVGCMLGSLEMEKKLHECFSEKRVRGEWFDLTAQDRTIILTP